MIVDRDEELGALARHLGAVGRAIRVHDAQNEAVRKMVTWCATDLSALHSSDREARVELDGDILVVSGIPVRLRREVRVQLATLSEIFRERGFGGFQLAAPVDDAAVIALFQAMQVLAAGTEREATQAHLDHAGAAAFRLLEPRTLVAGLLAGAGASVKVAATRALHAYLRAILAVRDARETHLLERIPPAVQRAVQALVEIAEEDPRAHLALAGLKEDLDFEVRHPVHAMILSLAIGARLGLDRQRLVDLAVCALMAATLPPAAPADAVIRDTASLVHGPRVTPGRARRMLARFEVKAGIDRSGPPGVPMPGVPHLYSRIAAIAIEFDAATTSGRGRRAVLPDEALGAMLAKGARQFDTELVRMFAALIGRYPLGSAVTLTSGEVGIVYHVPADPDMAAKPVLRIVRDARQRVLRDGPIVDLGDPAESRAITAAVDASAMGIDGMRALFG